MPIMNQYAGSFFASGRRRETNNVVCVALQYLVWSVCLSVKSHLIYGASVRPENAVTYSAGNESLWGFA